MFLNLLYFFIRESITCVSNINIALLGRLIKKCYKAVIKHLASFECLKFGVFLYSKKMMTSKTRSLNSKYFLSMIALSFNPKEGC